MVYQASGSNVMQTNRKIISAVKAVTGDMLNNVRNEIETRLSNVTRRMVIILNTPDM